MAMYSGNLQFILQVMEQRAKQENELEYFYLYRKKIADKLGAGLIIRYLGSIFFLNDHDKKNSSKVQ